MVKIAMLTMDQFMALLGYTLMIFLVGLLLLALIMLLVTIISIRRGKFYLPWLLRPGLIILESLARILWRMGKIDDREVMAFSVRLHNQLNSDAFSNLPMSDRMVFLPQCLRSMECPSALTTEGLICKRCNRCDIGRSIDELEGQGCKVFIVPGSTFVKRLIKKYHPKGIVGVGCLMEVKEGLEMTDRIGLIAMGVITSKDGCVETVLDWNALSDVVSMRPGEAH